MRKTSFCLVPSSGGSRDGKGIVHKPCDRDRAIVPPAEENIKGRLVKKLEKYMELGTQSSSLMRAPTIEEERERYVPLIKAFRQEIDALIQRVSTPKTPDTLVPNEFQTQEAVAQVRINLTNAKMWSGKILEALDNPFPPELADKAPRVE